MPFCIYAEELFLLVAKNRIHGYIVSSCITDIYYLVSKYTTKLEAKETIRSLLSLFSIINLNADDLKTALESDNVDYEDAIVSICAEKTNIDYIITRDDDFLTYKHHKTISPHDFIIMLNTNTLHT